MRRVAVLGLAALVLVAAGCGGQRLSQSQFEAKTKAICAGYTKRANKELGPVQGNPTSATATAEQVAAFGRLLEHVSTLFGAQLADLREVRPPGESEQRYRQVLGIYAQIESALTRATRSARKGDRLGILAAERELGALSKQSDALGFRCE